MADLTLTKNGTLSMELRPEGKIEAAFFEEFSAAVINGRDVKLTRTESGALKITAEAE